VGVVTLSKTHCNMLHIGMVLKSVDVGWEEVMVIKE